VFYCHTDFKFKNVKAVTFDGPGSRQMMERLSTGLVEGDGVSWDDIKQELDIVRYTAQPNAVNSTNNHVGVQYCVDPMLHVDLNAGFTRRLKDALKIALNPTLLSSPSTLLLAIS